MQIQPIGYVEDKTTNERFVTFYDDGTASFAKDTLNKMYEERGINIPESDYDKYPSVGDRFFARVYPEKGEEGELFRRAFIDYELKHFNKNHALYHYVEVKNQ